MTDPVGGYDEGAEALAARYEQLRAEDSRPAIPNASLRGAGTRPSAREAMRGYYPLALGPHAIR